MNNNLKPFIPAWLDEAGLSSAEFRTFCHILRSADNNTGKAWPSYKRMTKIMGMAKSTVRRCIEELERRKFIEKIGKPFGGSCRYRACSIVPPEGQKESSNSSTRGTNEAASIVSPEADNSPSHDASIVPPEGREGSPPKGIHSRKSKREISSEGIQFAQWFKSSLPESVNLKANWQESFARVHEGVS